MKNSISFENTQVAFSLKSNKELQKAKWLFTIIGISWIPRLAKPITNFLLRIKFLIKPVFKSTVFEHFCGGETVTDCAVTIHQLYEKGRVCSIPDYSVEGKERATQFDDSLNVILDVCRVAEETNATPFLVFKATALGQFSLFEKKSRKEQLTLKETEAWNQVLTRFYTIGDMVAQSSRLKVMIDAEESWIQDAIDQIAEEMMLRYNKTRCVIFNTIQLYRWDRLAYLSKLEQKARDSNFKIGMKLVRGAYMEKERERAQKLGYKNPICSDKSTTDINFDNGTRFCLDNLNRFEVFLGTHNEASSILLTQLMKEKSISNHDKRIWFGQLYGMSDQITFNLAQEGFNTAKYLPFGPVEEVIPYLLRRAEENSSVNSQTSRELFLINSEIKRRKTSG
jgi:proline dehydrogenase